MRNTILALALIIAGCAHNYADALAREASPGADRLVFGEQGVLVHDGDTILACFATAGRTQCHVIADWSRRPEQPQLPPVKAPEPAKSDTAPKPEVPKPEPAKSEEKSPEKKVEPKPAEKKK